MLFICQHTFYQLEKTAARKKPQLVETDMPDRESSPKTHDSVPLPITFLRQLCGSVKSTMLRDTEQKRSNAGKGI